MGSFTMSEIAEIRFPDIDITRSGIIETTNSTPLQIKPEIVEVPPTLPPV